MKVLQTIGLTHKFSKEATILNNVNLNLVQGTIYGFLGPNGAGKTTTLKLILGLLRKQQGQVKIFNQDFESNRVGLLARVGSLIESPSFYSHLTAIENLLLLQKIYRCPVNRIQDVLEFVDLPDTGKKKAGQFSLGMKQRLGIAIALLNNPQLLILDEPTNGLDPNGMIEMRQLLLKINKERGTTILISSHLLSEIEKLVTHIGIINKGYLLFEGSIEELKAKELSYVSFETDNIEATLQILQKQGLYPKIENQRVLVNLQTKERIASINSELIKNEVGLHEVKIIRKDLEGIFMEMIRS